MPNLHCWGSGSNPSEGEFTIKLSCQMAVFYVLLATVIVKECIWEMVHWNGF